MIHVNASGAPHLTLAISLFSAAQGDDKPIKVGAMFISSGPLGGYGINGKRAIEIAIEEINSAGGVLGRKLEASFGDTKLKPDITAQLADKDGVPLQQQRFPGSHKFPPYRP